MVVSSVTDINLAGVTLNLAALTEDVLGATVNVVNPNGVVVPVTAQDLSAGDTEVVFTFVTAYTAWTSMPSGTWTVNGTAYDFAAQLAVKAVNDATNQVALLAALQSTYFTDVNADLIVEYDALLDGTQVTVADVQAIIAEVNADNISQEAVTAVNEAENQVQLLAALQAGGFARVNADWIAGYFDYDAGADYITAADADAVQAIIDAQNLIEVNDDLTAAEAELSTTSITAVESLINTYIIDDTTTPLVTTKAGLLNDVAIHKAVIGVSEATTNNTLKSRLVALATVVDDTATFDIDTVNDVLLAEYRTAIAAATVDQKNTAGELQGIVTTVNTAQLTLAVDDVVTNFTDYIVADEDDQTAALEELNRLADVSDDVAKEDINSELIATYITDIKADIAGNISVTWATATDAAQAQAIQAIIEAANGAVAHDALAAVDAAAADVDADALLTTLKNADLAITNVVDSNKAAYLADKALIAAAIAGADDEADLASLKNVVSVINAVVDAGKATTADAMKVALTNYAANLATPNTAYLNLSSQSKLEVAELVLEERVTGDYADSAALTTALGATAAAGQLKVHADILAAVNAEDAGSTISEIGAVLALVGYDAYDNLSVVDQVAVSEAFLNNLPVDEDGVAIALNYKSLLAIKTDIDVAIATL